MHTCRQGFTLMEVMITVAIMAIVMAVSFPVGQSMWLGVRLDSGGDSVRASWAEGQSHAMNESRPYRFSYVPGTGNYRLAPDADEYWTGSGSPPPNTDGEDPTVVLTGRLPKGVFFQTNGAPAVPVSEPAGPENPGSDASAEEVSVASYQKLIVFMPDGTANAFTPNGAMSDYAEITLKIDDLPALIVSLRALTGVVTSRRENQQ
jgi:prepilin-type N-terminal cleavage/methylation domain-containing protein